MFSLISWEKLIAVLLINEITLSNTDVIVENNKKIKTLTFFFRERGRERESKTLK